MNIHQSAKKDRKSQPSIDPLVKKALIFTRQKKMSQADLARYMGVTSVEIWRWKERGVSPNDENREKLQALLNGERN